jgi:hypothetical protein
VAFDLLRLDGEDQRLHPIEARREALMRLVARVDGILFSEAFAAEGAVVFAKACEAGPRGDRVEAGGQLLQERKKPQLAQDQEPRFCEGVICFAEARKGHPEGQRVGRNTPNYIYKRTAAVGS